MERQELGWYADAVIYHIYALSLAKAPFLNNYSELRNTAVEIEKWIPHIKGMGFNTVLFSPIFKARTHGYDVTDYFEIDNRIGTNDDFKMLVKKLHDKGIRVVLDCVFNHCGRDFFAFKELQKNNMNFASWFSGVDFNRQSPMGDHFNYDTWSGYYELPKFNLKNTEVKEYLLNAARFWIDTFDIDGMRLDAADVLDKSFITELRQITSEKKNDFWLMGEVVHGNYSNWVNNQGLHSVTNYILYKSLFSSHNENNLYELAYCLSSSVPDNGLPLFSFLDNHDQDRIASIVSNPAYLNTLYALLFTLPGIPSVYYGSEWGFKGIKENGSDQGIRPYIDIEKSANYSTWLTGYINKLICIRKKEKTLKYGGYKQVYLEYMRPFIFERFYENEKIITAVNISNNNEKISLNTKSGLLDLLNGEYINSHHILIKPHSVLILKEYKL
ncbi:MAG: alpha-amylase family glycosyl hydrolase [Treponema sp.]|nr:alpha-amylase family glycosyl hydrolase [Treponema sp.]MCL2251633.1 alpha-amylase family glycosyl hydrolase [Treponema sp.]